MGMLMFPSLLEISLKRRKRNDRVFNNEFVVESAKSRLICGREMHDSLKSKQLDDPWSLAPVERSLVYGCLVQNTAKGFVVFRSDPCRVVVGEYALFVVIR
jgi:hypothetical protein